MPARFAITKSTAQGETMVTDICQWNPVTGEICHTIDEMTTMADEVLKLSDMRLLEMNTRVLEAESLEQYCTAEEWGKILSVIDVMCGRMSADLVKRRWQSALEETQELELGRLEALKKQQSYMCSQCFADEPLHNMLLESKEPDVYVCKYCAGVEERV